MPESVLIKSELLRSEALSALPLILSNSHLFLSPLERASETHDSNLARMMRRFVFAHKMSGYICETKVCRDGSYEGFSWPLIDSQLDDANALPKKCE